MMQSRDYTGAEDLKRMQAMLAQSIHTSGDCGRVHVGDVAHRIYNMMRRQPSKNTADFVRLWEDAQGKLLGWAILYPHFHAFDAQIHADHRGGAFEMDVLKEAESLTLALMRDHEIESDMMGTDAFDGDEARIKTLEALGYVSQGPVMKYTTRSLDEPIPDVPLPEGYSIRSAEGVHEAGALGIVHAGAFGRAWSAQEYAAVMESPGYHVENELVVVAPDGRFGAFTIMWFDPLNKMAVFEPVGTHQDFHRKGLGRALMTEGLRRMKDAGMQTAIVWHEIDNAASTGLYAAMGFRPKYTILDYARKL